MLRHAELEKISALMTGFDRPWYIAGGWAIDLFLERSTRAHNDVDVAILRRDQFELRHHLTGWDFRKVAPGPGGGALETWAEGEWLELPIDEIHAQRSGHDPAQVEFLLNESRDAKWWFSKNAGVTRPMHLVGLRSESGIPFLCPEVVLLYKATSKKQMPKNEVDFDNICEALNKEQRQWLTEAIESCHSKHAWLELLS